MTRYAITLAAAFGLFLLLSHVTSAATCTALTGTRNWGAVADWSCGQVPTASDSVIIPNSASMVVNTNTAAVASLIVQNGGTLTVGNNGTARTVTISGNFQLDSGGGLQPNCPYNTGQPNHYLNIGGSFTNNGSFTASQFYSSGPPFYDSCGGHVITQFVGSSSTIVSGSSATTLGAVLINKSNSAAAVTLARDITTDSVYVTTGRLTMGDSTASRTLTASYVEIGANGTLAPNNPASVTSHSLLIGGSFTNNGTFNATNGNGRIDTTLSAQGNSCGGTVSGTNATTFGNLTISKVNSSCEVSLARNVSVAADLTVSVGIFNVATYTVDRTTAGGALTVNAGATLRIGGTNYFPANYTTRALDGTVDYYTAGAQTVSAQTYTNLTLSGGGVKALGGASTVNGVLSMQGTATYANGGHALTHGGLAILEYKGSAAQITGPELLATLPNLRIDNANGVTLSSATTVNGTLYLTNGVLSNGVNLTLANGATISRASGSLAAVPTFGTSVNLIYTGSTAVATGPELPTSASVLNNLTISNSGGVTLNANATANGSLSLTASGALSIGANLLTLNGAVTCSSGTISSAASGTVIYNQGSDGQNVCPGSYGNLTFSDFNKILQSSGWISIAAAFTPGSATGHTVTGSTVNFNGTTAQTIPAFNYNNLLVSNTSAAVTASASFNVAGSLIMNGGNTVLAPAADVVINSTGAAGSITGIGTIRVTRVIATADYASQYRFTTNTLNNLTVDYAGAGDQTISVPSTYGGLRTSGSGAKTLAGSLTVGFYGVTIGAGTTLASNSFNITLAGNWTNNGGAFTPGTSTVTFNTSSVNPSIGGTITSQTFYNLTVSTSSGRYVYPTGSTFAWNIDGALAINSGGILYAPSSMNVKGNWANSGTFYAGGTVTLNGTTAQTISGSSATPFSNLTISNISATVAASTNFNVAGTMTVSSGAIFSPGASVVINSAAPAGNITGIGTIHVSRVAATADYASQYRFSNNFLNNLTVDYAGAGDQTINVPSGYRGLRTSGSGIKTLAGTLTVNTAGVTIGAGTTLASGNFNIALVGTGNWVNNGGAFVSGTGTVAFNGSGAQAIGGTASTAFSNLTINNTSADSAGVTLGIGQTVNGTLTLTDGLLKIGGYDLTLGTGASISGGTSAVSMVVTDTDGSAAGDGFLCKNYSGNSTFAFPVGDASGATEYSPATLDFAADLEPSTVCVRVTNVRHPNWPGVEYPTYLNRYWTATSTDNDFTCSASFVYTDADITLGGSQPEDALYHKVWNGSTWTTKNPTNAGANTLSSSVTSFSDHTAFSGSPLAVTLADFSAVQQGDFVLLTWETNSELGNRGFNLYRGVDPAGPDRQLNAALIPSQSPGSPSGFIYTWEDRADLTPGTTYTYWVEDVDISGAATMHGPVSATYQVPTAVTLAALRTDRGAGSLPWAAAMAAVACAAALLAVRKRVNAP